MLFLADLFVERSYTMSVNVERSACENGIKVFVWGSLGESA